MSKHTLGQWFYKNDLHGDGKRGYIHSKLSTLNEPIAVIPHDDCTKKQYKEARANAALIAAAPDLLEACKKAKETIDAMLTALDDAGDYDHPKWQKFCDAYDIVSAALDKVEGK